METFNKAQFYSRWRVEHIGTPERGTWAVIHRVITKEGVKSLVDRNFKQEKIARKWLEHRFQQARTAFFREMADRHWQERPRVPTLWDQEDDYVL